jgi:hypothetical protein
VTPATERDADGDSGPEGAADAGGDPNTREGADADTSTSGDSTQGASDDADDSPTRGSRRAATAGTGAARKAALLWGVIATLTLLVLVQGYQLLEFGTIPIGVAVVGAVVVFLVTTVLTYLLGP